MLLLVRGLVREALHHLDQIDHVRVVIHGFPGGKSFLLHLVDFGTLTKDEGESGLEFPPQPIPMLDLLGDITFKNFLIDVCVVHCQARRWVDCLLFPPLELPPNIFTVGVLLPDVLINLTLDMR